MRKIFLVAVLIVSLSLVITILFASSKQVSFGPSHPLVEAAREQIGVVTEYDVGYYPGGYPPADRGACSDVVVRALESVGFPLKDKIDLDMRQNPDDYPNEFDENINFRRVVNIDVFLKRFAESFPLELDRNSLGQWQAGDIVVFDQIPHHLWHIAIVSNKRNSRGVPFIIHNHGAGTVENDLIARWPAPIIGHYRMTEIHSPQ